MLTQQPSAERGAAVARGGDVTGVVAADSTYEVRFARLPDELDAVQRLRFDVFNIELGEGLASSFLTGRDADEYDPVCDHLMVLERASGRVIGTYRLMRAEAAIAGRGFYSTGEYDLTGLPPRVLFEGVELGRACVAREHRNTRVLFLLWRGIAAYVRRSGKRYLFGCCSLTSQDADEGVRVARLLESQGHQHPELFAPVRPGYECVAERGASDGPPARVPRLFATYLRFGARVCSAPAIDRTFGTIDFLVIFDTEAMDVHSRRLFFEEAPV